MFLSFLLILGFAAGDGVLFYSSSHKLINGIILLVCEFFKKMATKTMTQDVIVGNDKVYLTNNCVHIQQIKSHIIIFACARPLVVTS